MAVMRLHVGGPVFLLAVLFAANAIAQQTVTVTADKLNLRSMPNTTSRVVALLSKGDVLQVVEQAGGWLRVKTAAGVEGYVSATYVTAPSAAPAVPAPAQVSPPPEPPAAPPPPRPAPPPPERSVPAPAAPSRPASEGAAHVAYPRIVEGTFGAGFTAVANMEGWAGSPLSDWNYRNMHGAALVLPVAFGRFHVGGEVGYQYDFWATVHYRYNNSYHTYEFGALRFLGIMRADLGGRLFADFGGGLYRFSGFTDPGVTGAIGYAFPINERVSIPLKARVDAVVDPDGNVAAFTVAGGVLVKF